MPGSTSKTQSIDLSTLSAEELQRYIEQAATITDRANGEFALGLIYYNYAKTIIQTNLDTAKTYFDHAIECWEQAANNGRYEACRNIGHVYHYYYPQNDTYEILEKAKYWLEQGASLIEDYPAWRELKEVETKLKGLTEVIETEDAVPANISVTHLAKQIQQINIDLASEVDADTLIGHVAHNQSVLDQLNADRQALEERAARLQQFEMSLQQGNSDELRELRLHCEQLKKQLQEERRQSTLMETDLRAELESQKELIDTKLTSALDGFARDYEALTATEVETKQALEEIQNQKNQLERQYQIKVAENEQLQQELSTVNSQLAKREQQDQQRINSLNLLKTELEAKIAKTNTDTAMIQTTWQKIAAKEAQLAQQESALHEQRTALEQKLSHYQELEQRRKEAEKFIEEAGRMKQIASTRRKQAEEAEKRAKEAEMQEQRAEKRLKEHQELIHRQITIIQDGGLSPVLKYAEALDLEKVRKYLEMDYSPNVENRQGLTPLHIAIKNKRRDLVGLLIKHKANPNWIDAEGKTPLHYAAIKHDIKTLTLLLNLEKTRAHIRDKAGKTAMDYFLIEPHKKVSSDKKTAREKLLKQLTLAQDEAKMICAKKIKLFIRSEKVFKQAYEQLCQLDTHQQIMYQSYYDRYMGIYMTKLQAINEPCVFDSFKLVREDSDKFVEMQANLQGMRMHLHTELAKAKLKYDFMISIGTNSGREETVEQLIEWFGTLNNYKAFKAMQPAERESVLSEVRADRDALVLEQERLKAKLNFYEELARRAIDVIEREIHNMHNYLQSFGVLDGNKELARLIAETEKELADEIKQRSGEVSHSISQVAVSSVVTPTLKTTPATLSNTEPLESTMGMSGILGHAAPKQMLPPIAKATASASDAMPVESTAGMTGVLNQTAPGLRRMTPPTAKATSSNAEGVESTAGMTGMLGQNAPGLRRMTPPTAKATSSNAEGVESTAGMTGMLGQNSPGLRRMTPPTAKATSSNAEAVESTAGMTGMLGQSAPGLRRMTPPTAKATSSTSVAVESTSGMTGMLNQTAPGSRQNSPATTFFATSSASSKKTTSIVPGVAKNPQPKV